MLASWHAGCRQLPPATTMTPQTAFAWGLLSLVAILAAGMALTDIYHEEPDLTLEWRVLQVAFAIIVAFHVVALAALAKVIRTGE
jgi:hypothetical protein